MMEETHPGKAHGDPILIGGFNYLVVADGTAGFYNVVDTALAGALHIVAKGEERI